MPTIKDQIEIELDIIKSRLDSLEATEKWLTTNWVDWTKETKETGQKLMIALSEIVKKDIGIT